MRNIFHPREAAEAAFSESKRLSEAVLSELRKLKAAQKWERFSGTIQVVPCDFPASVAYMVTLHHTGRHVAAKWIPVYLHDDAVEIQETWIPQIEDFIYAYANEAEATFNFYLD